MDTSKELKNSLHIWVNRRRFDASHGLKSAATGAEIAAYIGVPADNARIDIEQSDETFVELAIDETVQIETGMQFLVTRHFVMGGASLVKVAHCDKPLSTVEG